MMQTVWLPIIVTVLAALWVTRVWLKVPHDLFAGIELLFHAGGAVIASLAAWAIWGVLT